MLALTGLTLVVSACSAGPHPGQTLTPEELLEAVEAEVIPREGTGTGYGIAFDEAGYATLIECNRDLRPAPRWAQDYERLDVRLPCCGAWRPFADETRNCGCGHHQALYGVAKYLLSIGQTVAETQQAVDRWRAYFFPRETLQTALEERSLSDPAFREALEALRQRGEC